MNIEQNLPKIDGTLQHIAIAVHDIDQSLQLYQLLGITFQNEKITVKDQQVITAIGKIGDNVDIELLMPLEKKGPIQKFLEKNNQGIHHICFRVSNLQETVHNLERHGYNAIYKETRIGAHGQPINFLHPKTSGGVLIELVEESLDHP